MKVIIPSTVTKNGGGGLKVSIPPHVVRMFGLAPGKRVSFVAGENEKEFRITVE